MNRWVLGSRPRTLPAAVVPVVVGTAAAVGDASIIWWRAAAALVVSLALQIGTNFSNDYSDGVRGTDDNRVGPTRLVASGLASARATKRAAMLSFAVAAVVGLALALTVAWWLVFVGAASVAAGWLYTGGPRPYGYAGLGEVFVFVFFGLVATVGSTFVQTEAISAVAVIAAAGVGCLAVAILVVNNLRDIPTDSTTAKRTLAVRIGDARTRLLYALLLGGAGLCVLGCAVWRPWALLGLLAAVAAVRPLATVRSGATAHALISVLGGTGKLQTMYGVLLAVGLAVSG